MTLNPGSSYFHLPRTESLGVLRWSPGLCARRQATSPASCRRWSSQSKTKFREVDSERFLSESVSLNIETRQPRATSGTRTACSQPTCSRARPPAHLVGEVRSQVTGAKGETEQGPPHVHLSARPVSRGQASRLSRRRSATRLCSTNQRAARPGARLLKGATPSRASQRCCWQDPGRR